MSSIVLELALIVVAMAFSDCLATLKTIFVAKKILKPVYVIVFINAVIFVLIVSRIVDSGEGLYYAMAFGVGKTLGVYIGGILEDKMAFGIVEVDVFFDNEDKMVKVLDELRKQGYSVNSFNAYQFKGKPRYIIEVTLQRKWLSNLQRAIEKETGKIPTMTVKDIKSVYGKIKRSL